METYRLKNIAIVILLLLNACLLLMVGQQQLQSLSAQRRSAAQLRELYGTSHLALDDRVELDRKPLDILAPARRAETEQAIASALLGGEALSTSQGGGIYSYEANGRTIQFRAGGSFYGSRLELPAADPAEFARTFCSRFGYEEPRLQLEGGTGSAIAGQLARGVPVINCAVELYFEDGQLASVTGAHVDLQDAAVQPGQSMSCVTALLKFLDFRNTSGVVCSEVTGVRCVYQLQSASAPRLLPVWEIATDTYTYFVDCATGEVYTQ